MSDGPASLQNAVEGALKASTQGVTSKAESELDERQQAVRDRAHRLAYRILACVFVVVIAYLSLTISTDAEDWLWLPQGQEASVVISCAVALTLTLPTAVVAWNEPDPEEE